MVSEGTSEWGWRDVAEGVRVSREWSEDVRQAVAAQGREPVPAEQEAEAAIAIMFGAGISMLDNTVTARRVLADHACLQLEMMALGGRMMAQGTRL